METQAFLDNFATIADAPGGIERLRRMVLDLAVQGRLVEQDPNDRPAVVDLEQIATRREAASQEMSLRRVARRLPPVGASPTRALPSGWAEVRLGDAFLVVMGNSPPGDTYNKQGQGLPLINGPVEFSASPLGRTVVKQYTTAPTRVCREGDLLVCVRGATTGRTNIAGFDACIGRGVALVRAWEAQPFVNLLVWNLGSHLLAAGKGTTFPSISQDDLAGRPILLPPLAEQERIVAKVDELMGLCDDLQARQQHRNRVTTRFRASALHALTEAETPDDFLHAWERASTHWPALTDSPDALDDLRQSIVHLAVTGCLTERVPGEGTADDLLGAASEAGLDDPALVDSEGAAVADPHPLPTTWRWVALGSLVSQVLAGWSAPSTQQRRAGDEWAVLKVSACTWGSFRPDENKALKAGTAPREKLEVREGDLIITRANTSDLVARSVVVDATPPRLMLSDKTLRLTPIPGCNPRYLNLANLAPAARKHYLAEATGTSDSMKNVSQRAIRRTPIPLPPAAEQDRIVAIVDQLNQQVDRLTAAILEQRESAERLADAAVR